MGNMPAAEVEIDEEVVRRLLQAQHPDLADLADLALEPLAQGWDNILFRLGDDLTVRLPRRSVAAGLVANEQRWLGELAPTLPLPIPTPTRIGQPDGAYPWSWSVCPWLTGDTAELAPPADPTAAASTLGSFVRALHVEAPPDAPGNEWRGVPLTARVERMAQALGDLDRLGVATDIAARNEIESAWSDAVAVDPWSSPPLWLHGDLHTLNVLVSAGNISGVIDWGDITSGDPACDLAIAWLLFGPGPRSVFREASGCDDATWARARGWALAFAVIYLTNSADHPVMLGMGRRQLAAALADP